MEKIWYCVDPGLSGGYAIFDRKGLVAAHPYDPDDAADSLAECCTAAEAVTMVIEEVGGHVGTPQPGSAMFRFGENFGWWRGLARGYGIPVTRVRPQVWQKGLPGLHGLKGPERKRQLVRLAREQFPQHTITAKTADAVLIGAWATKNHE